MLVGPVNVSWYIVVLWLASVPTNHIRKASTYCIITHTVPCSSCICICYCVMFFFTTNKIDENGLQHQLWLVACGLWLTLARPTYVFLGVM